jgi:hypothetical protein
MPDSAIRPFTAFLRPQSLWLSLCCAFAPAGTASEVSFNRDVRPILAENCYHCHGFDPSHRKGKLRLDTFEGATAERDDRRAITPGAPETSEAWLRITSPHDDEVMPPPESHKTLSVAQKETLRRWIAGGAAYEPHWAFVPLPDRVAAPVVQAASWPRGELDRFVLARLETEALRPAPEASRERWLRRVTFDLSGLPPTPAEIDTFHADPSPTAHAAVVDRLLASPRFGERMAVPWLDLARYADSYGYQADSDTDAWPYRDWVIRMLNANLPWDQFIAWQIAGDLLPGATHDQRLATAFNRIHRKTSEGGSVEEEFRQEGVSDRVHTFGTAFLGLTMECARCHDHKYDPISAYDYYALGAFFNSIDEFGLLGNNENRGRIVPNPTLSLPTPDQEAALGRHESAVRQQEAALREWPAQHEATFQAWLNAPESGPPAVSADLAAHYALDQAEGRRLANAVAGGPPAELGAGNELTLGPRGNAVRCSGDDAIRLPDFEVRHAHDPVSFAFWLQPAERHPRAVVLANSSSTDAPYSGYDLLLEDGRLRWSVSREFPGRSISIRTRNELPVGRWTHVTVTYDGSRRASGLALYVDGRLADVEVVRDSLTRDFLIGKHIEFGARTRDNGLRGGAVDDIHVFRRALTAVEAADLHSPGTLGALIANRVASRSPADIVRLRDYYFSAVDPGARRLTTELQVARQRWNDVMTSVSEIAVMDEMPAPRPTRILLRGAYDAPGDLVARSTPAALPPLPADAPRDRLGLARWLTDVRHPLTARVLINRLWQEFFGRGLVASSDNFGLQGTLPSHPELLDWLARDFIAHGWDFKRACREIVLSATYRQDSIASPELRQRDPENILLARGPIRRLSAEMLRDAALALGGLLRPEIGGPPVHPYQPDGSMWKALNNFLPEYRADEGPGLHRRSLYTFWRRTTTPPNMMAFDAPTRDVCTARRQTTNTPLQPLVLLNDPQFVEAARALGMRMLREGGETLDARLAWLFQAVTARAPQPREQELVRALFTEQHDLFRRNPEQAAALLRVGRLPADSGLPEAELAAATTSASALFNLDASIVLR